VNNGYNFESVKLNCYFNKANRKIIKVNTKGKNTGAGPVAACLFAVIIAACIGVSFIREKGDKIFPPPARSVSQADAKKLIELLNGGKLEEASICAGKISDDDFSGIPDADYLEMLLSSGLSSSLLTGPFSKIDAVRWRDAFVCAKIADGLLSGIPSKKDFPARLFNLLGEKFIVTAKKEGEYIPASISEILSQNQASVNELCRLSSEICLQAGFSPMVVSIHDEKGGMLLILLEVRGEDGIKAIVDFKNRKLFNEISARDIIKNPSAMEGKLQISPGLAKFARYHLPAEVQDYKAASSALRNKIGELIADEKLPQFGLSPRIRIEKIADFYAAEGIPRELFAYWQFPFFVMRHSPNTPPFFLPDK
jgi:hypothetical protein